MFDRLIDLLLSILHTLRPWIVVPEYHQGVLLRFGKYRRTLGAGLHFLVPYADSVDGVVVVWTTLTLPVQSIVTKDGRAVVAKGMVKYRVSDAKVFTIDTYDAKDALSDTACGILFRTIHLRTYTQCVEEDLAAEATTALKRAARRWGITVQDLTLTDFGEVRSLRLFNEGSLNT